MFADRVLTRPNSVRYRLHQVERLTGRQLARTEDLVDLYLAIQAQTADPATTAHIGYGE